MAKNKRITEEYHRQDLKIPIAIYESVCDIAQNVFLERTHHRSGKPVIQDTLIYLIQLGLEAIDQGKGIKPDVNTEIIKKLIAEAMAEHLNEYHNSSQEK